MWRNWNACLLLAVTEDGSRLWETCWLALKNLNIESSCDPAIPLWTHTQMSWKHTQTSVCMSLYVNGNTINTTQKAGKSKRFPTDECSKTWGVCIQ